MEGLPPDWNEQSLSLGEMVGTPPGDVGIGGTTGETVAGENEPFE